MPELTIIHPITKATTITFVAAGIWNRNRIQDECEGGETLEIEFDFSTLLKANR